MPEAYVDLNTWGRKAVFDLFGKGYSPYYSVTLELDCTELAALCKSRSLSFYRAMLYTINRAVNATEPFLYRIRPEGVVKLTHASPSYTVAGEGDTFGIVTVEDIPGESLEDFCKRAKAVEESPRRQVSADEESRDDLVFYSSTPWFSYTAVTQETPLDPNDSFPRILWGRYTEKDGRLQLPFTLQLNHRLLDGAHVQQLLIQLNRLMENCAEL